MDKMEIPVDAVTFRSEQEDIYFVFPYREEGMASSAVCTDSDGRSLMKFEVSRDGSLRVSGSVPVSPTDYAKVFGLLLDATETSAETKGK